jgi:uncharacterized iron-regulated membrane protein
MMTFRNAIFWCHLASGLTAGVVIFIMCVTGALLAFERNITEWSENDARYVAAIETERLTPTEILAETIEAKPEAKVSALARSNEPNSTWQVSIGREGILFVDPFTGAITGESNKAVRSAMNEFRNWHRYVALSGDQRPIGKAITGFCNLLFLFLAVSGIYIWVPRIWSWRSIKPVIWFRRGQRGKARNFNWHNTIGFWTSVFLVVFTITATVISYQWASNLLYTLTGNELPVQSPQQQPSQEQNQAAFEIPANVDEAWQIAEAQAPDWRSISLRLPVTNDSAVFTIDEGVYWNIFGRSTLTVDTNAVQGTKWDRYGDRNSAVQLRSWFRFTHTGESGGIVGQTIGFIACAGGAFLVWTGFSLALRRFGNWLKRRRNAEV